MGKRDELIAKYAEDIKTKIGQTPDLALLTKVTIGCGPTIYNADSSVVASSDKEELERVKVNFIGKKLGVTDGAAADAAIDKAIEAYGKSERNKYRAVFYYLIVKSLGRESVYA